MDEKTKNFFRGLVGQESKEEEEEKEVEVKPAKIEVEAAPASPRLADPEEFDEAEGQLTVDVYQTPDEIVVKQ